ncbi:MAG: chitobiase/beta-hexosaminidase C-terminal domain-containing protein [Rikenellaceae bacterium]|nr:chitobiase/beta-hexosaminidase C-terminal domain-containing protein [Rikenellaceae bacterium]
MTKTIVTFIWVISICFSLSADDRSTDALIIEGKNLIKKASTNYSQKDFIEAESYFERILQVDSKSWMAHYYIAFIDEKISHTYSADKEKRAQYIDKGINHLERAVSLNKKFSEGYILLASLYNLKIGITPNEAISLSSKAQGALKSAKKIDPENPRISLVSGISSYYTPEVYGGGMKKAKQSFTTAVEQFKNYKNINATYPEWGRAETYSYLNQIAMKEGDLPLAKEYYQRAVLEDDEGVDLEGMFRSYLTLVMPRILPEGGYIKNGSSLEVALGPDTYDIYYTTDGSEPTVSSNKYVDPIVIKENTVLNVRAISDTVRKSIIMTGNYKIGEPWPAKKISGTPGIKYSVYGNLKSMSEFDIASPVDQGVSEKIELRNKRGSYGVKYDGYINIPVSGEYIFYLYAVEDAQLIIDEKIIIDNSGSNLQKKERSFQLFLEKGAHDITVKYIHKDNNNDALLVRYIGPDIPRKIEFFQQLFH